VHTKVSVKVPIVGIFTVAPIVGTFIAIGIGTNTGTETLRYPYRYRYRNTDDVPPPPQYRYRNTGLIKSFNAHPRILASILARVLIKLDIQDILALHVPSHGLLLPLKG
jgi:hypothetical protein